MQVDKTQLCLIAKRYEMITNHKIDRRPNPPKT